MPSDTRLRASAVGTALAFVIGLSLTGGLTSLGGNTHGDTARAAIRGDHPLRHAAEALRRHHRSVPPPTWLVRVPRPLVAHKAPRGTSRAVGVVPAGSRYYHIGLWAWVEATARHGTWGRVAIPYTWPHRAGWIRLRGLRRARTTIEVTVDLSAHRLLVTRRGRTVLRFRVGEGAPTSPTPLGRYFVTDRIPFSAGSVLGTFAFGISGIQPRLPAGWSGGDQLAIHGTNEPWTIGRNASAGCVHVSERALHALEPLLRLGTPVVVKP